MRKAKLVVTDAYKTMFHVHKKLSIERSLGQLIPNRQDMMHEIVPSGWIHLCQVCFCIRIARKIDVTQVAVLPWRYVEELAPQTRYTLRRNNTVTTMKGFC